MKKLSQKGKRYLEIILLLATVTLAFLFWNTGIIYPFKLFTVLIHETSHGLMTILTGGNIKEIIVDYQLGGNCISNGGNSFLIGNAGYLGSLFCGGLLILSTLHDKYSSLTSTCLGILMILLLIFVRSTFGIIFIFLYIILFILIPRLLPKEVSSYLLLVFGTLSCLYSIIDIKEDLIQFDYRQTDAQLLEAITGVPAIVWGILWLTLSVVVFLFLLRIKFKTYSKNCNR